MATINISSAAVSWDENRNILTIWPSDPFVGIRYFKISEKDWGPIFGDHHEQMPGLVWVCDALVSTLGIKQDGAWTVEDVKAIRDLMKRTVPSEPISEPVELTGGLTIEFDLLAHLDTLSTAHLLAMTARAVDIVRHRGV